MVEGTTPKETRDAPCPVREVLSKATGKWQMLILVSLAQGGPQRFNALKRMIGDVTQRVLTENLRGLERDGYLTRAVNPGPPVAVTYSLTPLGTELAGRLQHLIDWAKDNVSAVFEARGQFDQAL